VADAKGFGGNRGVFGTPATAACPTLPAVSECEADRKARPPRNQRHHPDTAATIAPTATIAPSPRNASITTTQRDHDMTTNDTTKVTFTKTAPPQWLLDMWKEIDDKTFGKGFDCFAEDAICNLGVADWHGRETIRNNLRAFIDKGFTALHDVVEYWDSPALKVFRGTVTMTFDDPKLPQVKPTMTHFFYMDQADPTKVKHWYGSVGPTGF
jgi:hypothetical protein